MTENKVYFQIYKCHIKICWDMLSEGDVSD